MKKLNLLFSTATLLAALAFLPSIASAQSSIIGQAKDSSGAVMVGVSVQAASDALIEKQRTVTTDGQGRYAVVDVRPGTYVITFTMQGFATVKQSVDVPANTTVTIDGALKPGSVGETVNVEAAVATVDTQDVAHPNVLNRETMDEVPSARNMQSVGALTPGAHLNTPDPGGLQQVQQTYLTAHGNQTNSTTYLLDGILVNAMQNDGTIQTYIDNGVIQESTYQTSNVTSEIEGGGVYVNLVPKDGGNAFHADFFYGLIPSKFVGSNATPLQIQEGLVGQERVTEIEDANGSLSGPIIRDKLWFLIVGRKQVANLQSAGSFYANGSPGIEIDHIWTGTGRLTYQASGKNKFAGMWMRDWKTVGDDIVTGAAGYNDANPTISSNHRLPVMYYIAQARWTGTLTPRLILQAGISDDKLDYYVTNQPGRYQAPGTALNIADASELDTTLLSRSVAGAVQSYYHFDRYAYNFTGQYVTGSHQIKFGVMDSYGPSYANNIANGDAIYNYANGVPVSITAEDTPTYAQPYLDHDLGIYASDTWNYKRLSVTGGIRWEYLENHVNAQNAPAGRFEPARSFARIDCSTIQGLSCFKDWAPRLGMVYDLFGNHKTALKVGVGKYDIPIVSSNLNPFNPMFTTTQTVSWTGANTALVNGVGCQLGGNPGYQLTTGTPGCFPTGTGYGSGGVGPNPNVAFGQLVPHSLDPNYHREYNMQYSAGVQQELWRGITFNANWNRRVEYQEQYVINEAVPISSAAWTPVSITNPLDGTPITLFNLNPAYNGLTPVYHQTNTPKSVAANVYNGYEFSMNGRLPHKITILAGWSLDNEWDRSCAINANSATGLNDPNSLRFCDMSGQSGLVAPNGVNVQSLGALTGVPYRNEFKVNGTIPIKYGFQVSFAIFDAPVNSNFAFNNSTNVNNTAYNAFTADVQGFKGLNWTVTKSTKYATDCNCPTPGGLVDPGMTQSSEAVMLIAPGAQLTPRIRQDDLTLRRVFHIREKYSISAEFTVFNMFNQSIPLTQSESLGSSAKIFMTSAECSAIGNPTNCGIGGQPSLTTNPRMFRISTQFKF
jgi:hypothetical protein